MAGVNQMEKHLLNIFPSTSLGGAALMRGRILTGIVVQSLLIVVAIVYYAIDTLLPFILSVVRNNETHQPVAVFGSTVNVINHTVTDERMNNRQFEVIIGDTAGGEIARRNIFCDDISYILTSSADPTAAPDDLHVSRITIPESEGLPPISIRIQVFNDGKISSRMFYDSAHINRLVLLRRFGLDLVPIRVTENINILTDTIKICNSTMISFKSILPCGTQQQTD